MSLTGAKTLNYLSAHPFFFLFDTLALFLSFLSRIFGLRPHIRGPSINDVTTLGGRAYEGLCDNSTEALVIKRVTMGVSEIIKNFKSSFMDDP